LDLAGAPQRHHVRVDAPDWARAQTVGNPKLKEQKCNVAPLQTVADRAAQSGASDKAQRIANKVARKSPAYRNT